MQLFSMLGPAKSDDKPNMIVQEGLDLKTDEDLNNLLASYSLPTLGLIFSQYIKLFFNEKKISVEESCNSGNSFSKLYCKSIGQIENISKNKTGYYALKINQLIVQVIEF